jgi:hypothetical protein
LSTDLRDSYSPYRQSSISSLEFFWEEFKSKLDPLLDELDPLDKTKRIPLENQIFNMDKIIAKFARSKGVTYPNDDTLRDNESDFFSSRTNDIKNWIINLLEIFVSDPNVTKTDPESIGKLWNKFKKFNLIERYGNDPNYIEAKQKYKIFEWLKNNNILLPIVYDGNLFSIQNMRNYSIHHNTGITKTVLTSIPRDMKDLLTDSEGAGSVMILSSQTIGVLYCFAEIIQTWIDTHKIRNKGGLNGSFRYER